MTGWVATAAGAHLAGRRNRDTESELLLRRAVHAAGRRFRLHRRLASGCNPDFVLPGRRVAVWVDGDLWHSCPRQGRASWSGPNAQRWEDKMRRNRERDERANDTARELGWTVVRVWECEVRGDPGDCVRRILEAHEGR